MLYSFLLSKFFWNPNFSWFIGWAQKGFSLTSGIKVVRVVDYVLNIKGYLGLDVNTDGYIWDSRLVEYGWPVLLEWSRCARQFGSVVIVMKRGDCHDFILAYGGQSDVSGTGYLVWVAMVLYSPCLTTSSIIGYIPLTQVTPISTESVAIEAQNFPIVNSSFPRHL